MVGPEIFNEGRNDGETIFVGRKIILKIFFNFLKNIFTCQISFLAHRLIFILKNEVLDQIKGREWTHTHTHTHILTANDNDARCINDNLNKARLRWGSIAK